MTDRVRFHLNEHVSLAVAVALRKHGIAVTTTQEAGLIGAGDSTWLEYAHRQDRVMVTHDADYLRWHSRGAKHSGIAYCHKEARSIGQVVETLRLICALLTPQEMEGRVEFM